MNFDLENNLRAALSGNERLLWTGQPKAGIQFRASDMYIIPFSILWCSFAVSWEYTAARAGISIMTIWGIPFVAMGLYMIVGRFFVDAIKRKNTIYGTTDARVIIRSGIVTKSTQSLNLKAIPDISLKEKNDGTGTITFGPTDMRAMMMNGMGSWPGYKPTPAFEFIDDAKKVYDMVMDIQRKP